MKLQNFTFLKSSLWLFAAITLIASTPTHNVAL